MSKVEDINRGKRLHIIQDALGFSTKEMTEAMGYTTKSHYLRVRNGEVRITEDRLHQLRDNFNENLDYFLFGDERNGIILSEEIENNSIREFSDETFRVLMAYMKNWFIGVPLSIRHKRATVILATVIKIFEEIE